MIATHKTVDGLNQQALARFLRQAQKALKLKGEVSVLLTSSRKMRELNRAFRGKDGSTDVISFPAASLTAEEVAGDVAISVEIATANGRKFGHKTEDEIRILILHGLLHLAGYDHETDSGQMARKEAALRRKLGLPSNLIARSEARPRLNGSKRIHGSPAKQESNR